jgi:hypothetical protein
MRWAWIANKLHPPRLQLQPTLLLPPNVLDSDQHDVGAVNARLTSRKNTFCQARTKTANQWRSQSHISSHRR